MKNKFFIALLMLAFCTATEIGFAQENATAAELETKDDPKKDEILKAYAWTKAHFENKSVVSIVQMKSDEGYEYILVESDDTNTLFDTDGEQYCADHEQLNCVEFYKLSATSLSWKRS